MRSRHPESRALAIEQAANCPAGRLVVWDKDGSEIEPELAPSIGIVEDPAAGVSGPLWVRGRIPVESADGYVYEIRNRVTLCRCGRTGNSPFCDGAHARSSFNDGDASLKKPGKP
jgi:CDGSH-type Zn-finger protein